MIVSETTIRVRYAETDKMGVAYHGNYFTWLEVGRVLMMDELGLPYRQLEEEGFLMPVLQATAKYLRPARFDDEVLVRTLVRELPTVRMRIAYELECLGEKICTAATEHVFINPSGRPVRPPQNFIDVIERRFKAGSSAT